MIKKNNTFTLKEKQEYAWQYFSLHAEQRLKTFHFYIIIITLLLGAILTTEKLELTSYTIPLAGLITFFSFIFWKLDNRNKELIHNAESELKKLECKGSVKLFINEEIYINDIKLNKNELTINKHYTFTESFKLVFFTLGIIGIIIMFYTLLGMLEINIDYEQFYNKNIKNTINDISNMLSMSFVIFGLIYLILLMFFIFKNSKLTKKKVLLSLASSILISSIFTSGIKLLNFDNPITLKVNEVTLFKKTSVIYKDKTKLITFNILYFDQGNIILKEHLSKRSDLYVKHLSIIKQISELLDKLEITSKYYIKINGYASLKKVNSESNKISDNYQISMARASSVKMYILDILLKRQFPVNNIEIDIFANSNEYIENDLESLNRKVEIEIYKFI